MSSRSLFISLFPCFIILMYVCVRSLVGAVMLSVGSASISGSASGTSGQGSGALAVAQVSFGLPVVVSLVGVLVDALVL